MYLLTLPLERRTETVLRLLTVAATQIKAALMDEAGFLEKDLLRGSSLPAELAEEFRRRFAEESHTLANKRVLDWEGLWKQHVADARARWGNDAVDEALKRLIASHNFPFLK